MSLNRSNPGAWGRAPQSQQLNPNLFTAGQINLAQPFGAQPMALVSGVNALVNQAAFGNVNNAALLAAQQQQQQRQPADAQNSRQPNQRTFVGQVTKLMDNYGFIDEDVFFQTSVIRGNMPRVGDRVMVEATFNPSMPFKWNAFRIQGIDNQVPQQQQQQQQPMRQPANQQSSNRWGDRMDRGSRDDRAPRGTSYERNRPQRRPSPLPPRRDDRRSPIRRSSPPRRSPIPRRQSPIRRELPKRERERSPIVRESREPLPKRSDSPPRRRQRIIPRYQSYIPRPVAPDFLNYTDLHKRYGNLYIPSDFVRVDLSWKNSFNLESPIAFSSNSIDFHVLQKDVDYPFAETNPLPEELPADADSRYIVKVLLPAHPGAIDIRKKVTGLLADGSIDESLDVQNVFKVLHFITGNRGKGEVMGIGGAYSPSLDGENPLDPQTLIKTAVRTTLAMSGVDLSNCPTWYKMLHLRYYRVERDRWDHVVLLMPDTGATPNFLPTLEDYTKLIQEILPEQLKQKIAQIEAEPFVPQSEAAKKVQTAIENKNAESNGAADESDNKTEQPAKESTDTPTADVSMDNAADSTVASDNADSLNKSTDQQVADNSQTEANGIESTGEVKKINWAQLQVKSLKVAELREQLDARSLDSKGVKNILAQRLQEALDAEKASEETAGEEASVRKPKDESVDQDIVILDEIPKAADINPDELICKDDVDEKMDTSEAKVEEKPAYTKEEKDEHKREVDKFEKSKKERKSALERHYTFPKDPCVFVYPNKTAKSGKFDCRSVTVQSLLDYRIDDNKESSFEAFLFAESFHEAIDRGHAFKVYQTLNSVLDKEAERKRRDEALTKVETPMETDEPAAANGETEKPAENGVEVNGEQKAADEEKPAEEKSAEEKSAEEKSTDEKSSEAEKKEEKRKEKSVSKDDKGDPRLNFKALVNDVDTFTAFSHFDQNICGYLTDRDIEEVLHSIGLSLSRAAVQRLIRKVSSRDRFNYRNITDKWVDKDFNLKYCPEPLPDAPTRVQLLKAGEDEADDGQSKAPATGSTPDVTSSGVVFYKGSVLNIAQAQEQHKLVEAEKAAALLKIQELESVLKTTKEQRDHSDKKLHETQESVAHSKKKLQEAVDFAKESKKKLQESIDIVASQLDSTNAV